MAFQTDVQLSFIVEEMLEKNVKNIENNANVWFSS